MYTILNDRAVILISGPDKSKFLQGMLTNNINKLEQDNAIYACMLTPQGKYFADFFLKNYQDNILADIPSARKEEIINKLKIYKLRSNVDISINSDFQVVSTFAKELKKGIAFLDPRSEKMGWRCYIKQNELEISKSDDNAYDLVRINNLIAEGDKDLIPDKSFIQEYGFDNLNAIDYQKGCYVGQELISRTHYSGVIRKKIFYIKSDETLPMLGTEIYAGEIKLGIICSSIDNEGLALIKYEELLKLDSQIDLIADNIKINVIQKES